MPWEGCHSIPMGVGRAVEAGCTPPVPLLLALRKQKQAQAECHVRALSLAAGRVMNRQKD